MTASGRKALSSNTGNGNGNGNNGENNTNSLSRKASKPLMEKRRRARINESLTELKKIVVNETDKSGNSAKLEKADILEMTVKYLREVCESQRGHTWRDGFDDCLQKTKRFLTDTGHSELSTEISLHLENNCSEESEPNTSDFEPINLAVYSGNGREDTFVWRPW